MTDRTTELDLVVGSMITTQPSEDRQAYEQEKDYIQDVQDLLREEGVVVDLLSQPGTQVWEGGIESFYDLYQLRRLAAHLERGDDPMKVLEETSMDGEELDDLLVQIWDEEVETKYPHLIKHIGDGGYYLPAEFDQPIWVESDGDDEDSDDGEFEEEESAVSFGSSPRLLRELTELESLLDQHKIQEGGARVALEVLKTAAQQSVEHVLPIILW